MYNNNLENSIKLINRTKKHAQWSTNINAFSMLSINRNPYFYCNKTIFENIISEYKA